MALVVAQQPSKGVVTRAKRTYKKRKKTFMSKGLRWKRYNNVEKKTFYFSISGAVLTNLGNNYQQNFRVNDFTLLPAPPGATAAFSLYDSYQIRSMHIKAWSANVGIEPDTVLFGDAAFLRGNAIIFSDNYNDNDNVPAVPNIESRINYSSCRMIDTRKTWSRYLNRPRGNPEWRSTGTSDGSAPEQDQWKGFVCLFGQGNTPSTVGPPIVNRPLWYFKVTYKVTLRGRAQG